VPKLIEVAQTNRNAAVRKQAMFWLDNPTILARSSFLRKS